MIRKKSIISSLPLAGIMAMIFNVYAQNKDNACVFRYVFDLKNTVYVEKIAEQEGKLPPAMVKGGASVSETGALKLDGKSGYVEIPKSENIHITKKGGSFFATVKFYDDGEEGGKPESHDMIFFKEKEFLLGRDGKNIYFNFHDGKTWVAPMTAGEIARGAWTHIAVVVERIDDAAQGDVGYKPTLYINGDPVMAHKFRNVDPQAGTNLIEIGKGWGGPWFFNGEIAEVSMFDRALTEGEVLSLLSGSKLVRTGEKEIKRLGLDLTEKLDGLIKTSPTAIGCWAAAALKRAGECGYNEDQLKNDLDKTEKIILEEKDESAFRAKWNQTGAGAEIVAGEKLLAMVVTGGNLHSPLAGVMDRYTGKEIFGRIPLAWTISYVTNGAAKPETVKSVDGLAQGKASVISREPGSAAVKLEWNQDDGKHPFKFKAISNVRLSGSRIEMDFNVENLSPDIAIRDVTFPLFRFGKLNNGPDKLLYPRMSGVLVDNPTQEQYIFGQEGFYPSGNVPLQFGAYYDNASGIYFAFEDPLARSKFFSVKGKRGALDVYWTSYPGIEPGKKGGNSFRTSGKAAVEVFRGDWFDAGQIYKRWLAREATWWLKKLPRQDTPQWFRNNCLWIIMSSGSAEKDSKLVGDLTAMRKYMELPFGVHWYGWEDLHKADNMPHAIPREGVPDLIKRISTNGIYVKPYIDSHLFAVLDGEKREKDWMFSTHGKLYAVKDPAGEMTYEIYNKKKYAVMCPASKGWQDWVVSMTDRIAGYGASAVYHDQVATSSPRMCFDKSHGHMLGGGEVWLENGRWPMFDRIRSEVKAKYPDFAQDTEENSDPYAKAFDGYMVWRWTDYNQVPLFPSIYAGRMQFTGKLFDDNNSQSFCIKCAEQLVNSEQIGWFSFAEIRNFGDRRLFAKKMAHLRLSLLDWFNEAEMLHPLKFTNGLETITSQWGAVGGPRAITTPKIRHSVWKRPEGVMIVFVNSVNEKVSARPAINSADLGFGDSEMRLTVCREASGKAKTETIPSGSVRNMELAPFCSEVWFLNPAAAGDGPLAGFIEKTSSTLRKINGFDEGKIAIPMKFTETEPREVSSGRWITTSEVVDLYGAARQKDGEFIGWMEAVAVLYFGTVDFGDQKKKRKLEVEIAVSPQYKGGQLQFFMDSAEENKGRLIGGLNDMKSTGGWDKFKVVSVPMEDITGQHKFFVKVVGTACCNFKKWRIVSEAPQASK